jgi:hypothetical protein
MWTMKYSLRKRRVNTEMTNLIDNNVTLCYTLLNSLIVSLNVSISPDRFVTTPPPKDKPV